MPYGRRIDWPGAMHHVMSRGIDGLEILQGRNSKQRMLSLWNKYFPLAGARVHAWALMNNHFHLLSSAGMMCGQSPSLSEISQTWTRRTYFLGSSAFVKDVIQAETDRRILPTRERKKQHDMALSALESISSEFNIRKSSIMGRSRRKPVILARRVFIHYLILYCGFSFSDAGRFLNKSRQSIRYLFNKHTEAILAKALQGNK